MERKIESAYIYLDYRLLLNDDFIFRSEANHSYSLRAYARDLDISPTFLSEILRGKKDLSIQNCQTIFSKIGLDEKELVYVENLVQSKKSKFEHERLNALEKIKNQYAGKEYVHQGSRELLLKTLPHFVIFGLIRKIQSKKTLLEITARLGFENSITNKVIEDYENEQYIECNGDEVKVVDKEFTMKNHENLVEISNHFNFLLHSQIQKENGIEVPDRLCHALILGVSQETYEVICEAYKHFIKTVVRLSDQDKNVERIVFISDVFYRMPKGPE